MRALRLTCSPSGPGLSEADIPRPEPGPGELLIRVCAAGVTAAELLWYPSSHTKSGEKRVEAVPCHEFSGIVADIGENAGAFTVGQEVFGTNDWFSQGALAEYCVAPASSMAPKPPGLSHADAACIPVGALTAWQGLYDHAGLQRGERILIHGGSGAVGVFAIQFAHLSGAHVITTASASNLDFVRTLGAEEAIDYRASSFDEGLHDLDVVFDTVGGETLERSWKLLKPNGRMVTIVSTAQNSPEDRVQKAFFIVEPNQKQLIEIANLLDTGRTRAIIDRIVPFPEAPAAYAGHLERSGRGKVVVAVKECRDEQTQR
jgi:NADPH:quinone reductase-like Zn-dependent oxidoreductase